MPWYHPECIPLSLAGSEAGAGLIYRPIYRVYLFTAPEQVSWRARVLHPGRNRLAVADPDYAAVGPQRPPGA